jgi:hypothetical protein
MGLTAGRNSAEKRKLYSPAWDQTPIPRALFIIPTELRWILSSTVTCDRILYSMSSYSKYRLYGLEVRVTDYRSRGPGLDFRRYQIF